MSQHSKKSASSKKNKKGAPPVPDAPDAPDAPSPDVPEPPSLAKDALKTTAIASAGIGAVALAAEFSEALNETTDSLPPSTGSGPTFGGAPGMSWESSKMKNVFSGASPGKLGAAMSGLKKNASGAVKFDIFRDTFQFIGVTVSGITLPPIFSSTFGFLASLVALDLGDILPLSADQIFMGIAGLSLLTLIFFWIRMLKSRSESNRTQDGLEVQNWAEEGFLSRWGTRIVLTGLTTLYLPISKTCLQLVLCTPEVAELCTAEFGNLTYLAYACLLFVTLLFPYQMWVVIKREQLTLDVKPFDNEGNPREITEELYQDEVNASHSPYAFLFKGFTKSWAGYKVVIMLLKLVLSVAVVVLSDNEGLSLVATTVILGIWLYVAGHASQYVDPWDDLMDTSGRWITFLTSAIATAYFYVGSIETTIDYILSAVNAVNLILMIAIPVLGSDKYAAYKKKRDSRLDFTMEGSTPLVFSDKIDLVREKKSRVWQPFWDSLMSTSDELKAKKGFKYSWAETKDTPPYLKNFEGSVEERHAENKRIVSAIGAKAMRAALAAQSEDVDAKNGTVDKLIGVDVYHKSSSAGTTAFGKLYVVPFPFTTVMFYDDGKNHVLIKPQELEALLAENAEPEIERRRLIRHQLRATHDKVIPYHFVLEKEVDVVSKVRNEEGETVDRRSEEKVKFVFESARVVVEQNSGPVWTSKSGKKLGTSAGFLVKLFMLNGVGYDSQGAKRGIEEHVEFGMDLGLTNDYAWNDGMKKVLLYCDVKATEKLSKEAVEAMPEEDQKDAKKVKKVVDAIEPVMKFHDWIENGVADIRALHDEYRQHWREQYVAHAETLSYNFFQVVYNRSSVPRETVEKYLQTQEVNPVVQAIPRAHKEELDAMYAQLDHFDAHPANLWWYVYWSDVWANNSGDTELIKTHAKLFDPAESKAIMYTPLERKDLSDKLSRADPNLLKYFNSELLDKLFEGLAKQK